MTRNALGRCYGYPEWSLSTRQVVVRDTLADCSGYPGCLLGIPWVLARDTYPWYLDSPWSQRRHLSIV